MANSNLEYEMLVAAFALRDPQFAADYGRILGRISHEFFGHFTLPDIVKHGLTYFSSNGDMLAPEALKADMAMVGRDGISRDTYMDTIDQVFKWKLVNREHVEESIINQARMRLLAGLGDPGLWIAEGRHREYLDRIREIEGIGRTKTDSILMLADDFDVLIKEAPSGMPIGFPTLDAAFNGGGLCKGEIALLLGRYNIGKSRVLNNCAVNMARFLRDNDDDPGFVYFVSFETSLRNTRMRLAKVAIGWGQAQVEAEPQRFTQMVQEELGSLPLFVKYTNGGEYDFAKMERDIKQAEDRLGVPCKVVIRDYGELMASDPDDTRQIRASYKGFKDFVGKHEIRGLDAAQKNRQGKISHFNLLKDADILIDLDRPVGCDTQLIARIERNREGPAGKQVLLTVEPESGLMKEATVSIDDDFEYESDSKRHAQEEKKK